MKFLVSTILLGLSMLVSAQEIMRFSIVNDNTLVNAPVSVSLDNVNYNTDNGTIGLFEVERGVEIPVACQLETGHSTRLWFILPESSSKVKQREFVVKKAKNYQAEKKVELDKDIKDLKLSYNGKSILNYRYALTYPPEDVNPLYKRSGFVHPLVSPEGEVLTNIQPDDHYHHYGIWGPWTKTHIKGREVDFWNLIKGEGTVKFAGFLSETEGNVFSGFKAYQQHIDFGAKGEDQIAINEVLEVRAWNIGEKKWLVDYTVTLNCPLDSGIMLDAYRYGGGIGYRATEKWHKDNCTVLTSEGKNRAEADGTNARWCMVEGESNTQSGRSGILFMSFPANRMHPEPMRIWPLNANGDRGDMYFEFCPIRHNDWQLEKGKDYTLKYRLLVFDGQLTADEAENYWKAFANPVRVEVEKE